ncbi:MAG: hypothetical protein C0404_08310, partial [Verrucomicrobia bacterium]|nr:hypothetical protein [Verrucomicrobiota bacterium]
FGVQGSGTEFVKKLFHVIRPYGGRAWLPLSAEQHAVFQTWVTSAGLSRATVTRSGNWTILERTGALAGSIEFTATNGTISASDQLVKAPFGVSWFGNYPLLRAAVPFPTALDVVEGRAVEGGGAVTDVYTGIPRTARATHSGVKTVSAPVPKVSNPLFDRSAGIGFSGTGRYGIINAWTSYGYAGLFNDYASSISGVFWGGIAAHGENIGGQTYGAFNAADGTIPANGMFMLACMYGSCSCQVGVHQGLGLYHRDDVESWSSRSWQTERSGSWVEELPLRKAGINFGAPGSRVDDNNILWLDIPRHQAGESAVVATFLTPAEPETFYRHSGWFGGDSDRKWVAASGIKNVSKAEIQMNYGVQALQAAVAPVIDGDLSDACWDGQLEVQLNWNQTQGAMRQGYEKSRAMARFDSDNLYISIEHPYVTWPTSGNDDFMVYLLGREQVGLDGSGKAVSFKLSRAGGKIAAGGYTPGSWTNDWSGAYAADTNSRRSEFAIPFSTLRAAGLWPENLVVNLRWNSNGGGYYNENDRMVLRQRGYSPLYLGALRGLGSMARPHNVKLYFAETEGATAGQRKFNVSLQGSRVLTSLDVASEAGGQNLPLVREFPNVNVTDRLTVELESVTGQTMISGVELVGTWDEASYPNQSPVARIETDVVSGPAPLAVTLSGWGSSDADGQIADCRWDCGDGALIRGSKVTHVFTEPGVYTVSLLVIDERGAAGSATTTVTVGAGVPAAFVCKIRASGGDYGNLSAWHAAIRSDLTSKTRLFTLGSIGSYTNTDIGKSVTFAGGGTGVLLWADPVRNEAAMVNCAGTIETGTVTVAGGRTFTVVDTGVDTASLLFTVTDRGTYAQAADDGKAVTFSGGGRGYLRHINTANIAYITECRGAMDAGAVTTASGHAFTIAGAGSPIYTAVAEGYNDWPATGLQEGLTFSGWIGDANRTTVVRAAPGHGHAGKLKDAAGKYTGFALTAGWPNGGLFGVGRVTGIIVDGYGGVAAESVNRVITKNGTITPYSTAANSISLAINGDGFRAGGHNVAIINCTSVDANTCFPCTSSGYYQNSARYVNCLARPKAGGTGFAWAGENAWMLRMSYCVSSDGSADDWGTYGEGREFNKANATFTFVNAASNDFRLAETDMGARGWGTAGFGADIEGQERQAPYDIGADETVETGDWDGDGIPDTSDPDDDNDGVPDVWESANGLNPRYASDAGQDGDGDGMSNLAEYVAGTNPRDARERFHCSVFGVQGGAFRLSFQTVTGRLYGVIYRTNLFESVWHDLTNNVPGTGGQVEISDPAAGGTGSASAAQRYYRIKVKMP